MIAERDGQLHIAGEMNQRTATALLAEGNALVGSADCVFNLAAVEAVDSCALAVLLGWMRAAHAAGRRMDLVEAPAALVSLADLYGVGELIFSSPQASEPSARH